jgi:L,D-transpeptidase catalytic domain
VRRAALLGALLVVAGCGSGSPSRDSTTQPPRPTTPVSVPVATGPGPGPFGARLRHATTLRARPGGRVLARLPLRTEFGSMQILAVARRREKWLAVRSPALANGGVGWVRAADAQLLHEPWRLEIDLSRRRLTARREGRRVFAIPVAIGAPGTPTPSGRFGVTDRLKMSGSTYGCCALALSGHQPNIPQGWGGGDRIAIHGTTAAGSIGTPASHGCLRASDAGMRRLMAVVPLGTTVDIHA